MARCRWKLDEVLAKGAECRACRWSTGSRSGCGTARLTASPPRVFEGRPEMIALFESAVATGRPRTRKKQRTEAPAPTAQAPA